MPPSRNNTVKFTDLQAISSVNPGDIIPVVDTSVPTLVNKKINVQDFSRSLPVTSQVAQMGTVSANWNSNYSTTQSNSAFWGTGGSYGSTYSANSAEYESTYSLVNTTSANWNSAYTTLNSTSGVYTTVQNVSGTWNTGTALASSAYTSLNALSTGTWLLKAGDQLTGTLTTTKTLTTQFTNMDELVSKRYVDAISTISGNFVPSLYYTKNDFSTGVPLVCATSLQTNAFALGTAGGSQTGILSFNPNQYGTSVTGFTLDSTNNRTGLRIIAGTHNRFNASEQGLSYSWGGPAFAQNIFTLGDSNGNNAIAVDHYGQYATPSWTAIIKCNPAHNLILNNYSTIAINNSIFALSSTNNSSIRTIMSAGSVVISTSASRGYNEFLQNRNVFEVRTSDPFISLVDSVRFGVTQAGRITFTGNPYDAYDIYYLQGADYGIDIGSSVVGRAAYLRGDVQGSAFTRVFARSSGSIGFLNNDTLNTSNEVNKDVTLYRDAADTLALRRDTNRQNFRIYNTYTDANNYERLSLSANRIAYEFAGTGASRDLTILTTGNLILSAGASIQLSQALPFQIAPLSSSDLTAPNGLTVVTGGGTRGVFAIDQFGHGVYGDSAGGASIGSGGGEKLAVVYGGMSYFKNSPNRSLFGVNDDGKVYIGRLLGNYYQTNYTTSPRVSAHVSIITDSSYNSHVTDMLLLSAGPNVSISNYINCVSAGQTIFSVNSTGQFNTANFSADFINLNQVGGSASYNTGVLRIPNDVTGQLRPGLWSYGSTTGTPQPPPTSINSDISLATFGGGSHQNRGFIFSNAILTSRIATSPNIPSPGSGNFDEGISDLSLKVAGRIGFTDTSLGTSNFVRTVSATMGYDWSTNLISLSSRTGKVGFRFDSVEVGNNRPEIYNTGNLYITNNFGGGRRIYFNGSDNQGWNPFELGYNGAFAYGTIEITATQQPGTYTFPYLKITQDIKQLSNFVQIVSSNSSTILSYTSAGVLNLNSKMFLKPEGLIQFNSISSTTPAIKGTSTTIQARTGDDSQYTYLQGKLQTDQAASAGTFTPDKYIILYDNTGTAYKVPVQAL